MFWRIAPVVLVLLIGAIEIPSAFGSSTSFIASAPSVFTPPQAAKFGNFSVSPTLVASGSGVTSQASFVPTTVSPLGVISVGETGQSVVLDPNIASGHSGALKDGVDVFSDGWESADLAIRASAAGAQAFESIRSPAAPESYPWSLSLPAGTHLLQLNASTVAIMSDPHSEKSGLDASPDSLGLGDGGVAAPPDPAAHTSPAKPVIAPWVHPPSADELIGNAGAQVREAIASVDASKRVGRQPVIALVSVPWAHDATGAAVPTGLSAGDRSLTIFVRHRQPGTVYPITAAQRIVTAQSTMRATIAVMAAAAPDVNRAAQSPLPPRPAEPASTASGYFQFNGFTGLADSFCGNNGKCPASSVATIFANNFLGVKMVRAIVPWDVFTNPAESGDLARFRAWYLWALTVPGHYINVSFQADPADVTAPSFTQYVSGVAAMLGAPDFPEISVVSSWNEPNENGPLGQPPPTPTQATQYLAADAYICALAKHCSVIAGDFYDVNGDPDISSYFAELGRQYPTFTPTLWGFHGWRDVRTYEQNGDRSAGALKYVDGLVQYFTAGSSTLWDTEVGAPYTQKCGEAGVIVICPAGDPNQGDRGDPAHTQVHYWAMDHQAQAAAFALELANVDPTHIQAVLYYNYQTTGVDDSGLFGSPYDSINPGIADPYRSSPGSLRQAVCVLQDRVTVDDPRLPGIKSQVHPSC